MRRFITDAPRDMKQAPYLDLLEARVSGVTRDVTGSDGSDQLQRDGRWKNRARGKSVFGNLVEITINPV